MDKIKQLAEAYQREKMGEECSHDAAMECIEAFTAGYKAALASTTDAGKEEVKAVGLDVLISEAFDTVFDLETTPFKSYSKKELEHDIKEAIKQGIEDYRNSLPPVTDAGEVKAQ